MVAPRLQCCLQGVVVGIASSPSGGGYVYIAEVGEHGAVLTSREFSRSVGLANVGGDASERVIPSHRRRPPSANWRLVKINQVFLLKAVVPDVGYVQGQVIGNRPLDIKI